MEFIKAADVISTSGRSAALHEEINKLPDPSDKKHGWRTSVYSGLTHRIFYEYHKIKEAHERNDDELASVAWHARNLLELTIWCVYCEKHDDNARRFYEDAGRDHYDLLKKFGEWQNKTNRDSLWQEKSDDSLNSLIEQAEEHQVLDLKSNYLHISNVAKNLGLEDIFNIGNKMLSKFAHPTAGYVVLPFFDERAKVLKTAFFNQGCAHFIEGFKSLERRLCS